MLVKKLPAILMQLRKELGIAGVGDSVATPVAALEIIAGISYIDQVRADTSYIDKTRAGISYIEQTQADTIER